MATEVELAWAAGFWDGEGHCGIHKAYLKAEVQQSEPEILKKFQQIVGVGKLYGPYKRKSQSPVWQLSFSSRAAAKELFNQLSPYLSATKFNQFSRVFEIAEARKVEVSARRATNRKANLE